MNQQNTMAATAAANLVQGIATTLYGEAGSGVTDLIALNNLVNRQSARLAPSNPLLAVARRNIRQFLAKAAFASSVDRWSAGQCLDVIEAAVEATQPPAPAAVDEALVLRRAAAVLEMWEGDPNLTGYMGDFKDACNILELLAHHAPLSRNVDLRKMPRGICLFEIPSRNNLDPINVLVQDYEVGRGRIVVTCYGQAWCGFWGDMGNRTVMQFVATCDAGYIASNMLNGRHERILKRERAYVERVAAEVIAEFRTLSNNQRDAATGVANA